MLLSSKVSIVLKKKKLRSVHHIFTLLQILEKISRHTPSFCRLAAFDMPIRDRVFDAMSELDIPAKLIWLCRMTLSNSCSSVKVGMDLSEPFDTVRGFRQGYLFNFVMESVLRMTALHRNDTILQKSVKLLAKRDISAIEQETTKIGLAVNEVKTKYMLSPSRNVRHIDS